MNKIPETDKDIREILCKQLALLAEISGKNKGDPNLIAALSHEMCETAKILLG